MPLATGAFEEDNVGVERGHTYLRKRDSCPPGILAVGRSLTMAERSLTEIDWRH
jgi:hypothetical protein